MSVLRSAFAAVVLLVLSIPAWAPSLATPERTSQPGLAATGDPAAPSDSLAAPPIGARSAALDALRAHGPHDGYFLENRGQVAAPVRFYAAGNPSVAFREDGVMFVLRDAARVASEPLDGPPRLHRQTSEMLPSRAHAYLVRFDGARDAPPRGVGELPFRSNFLMGSDSARWRTGVPAYREVVYEDLYPGVDLAFRLAPAGVKYEFRLRPGADPAAILLTVDGAGLLAVGASGLAVATPLGTVRDSAPLSFQGDGSAVACRFAARGPRSYGFDCVGRDASQPLTIDPLVYSTLLGGSDDAFIVNPPMGGDIYCGEGDRGVSIDVDPQGNAYVFGNTCSTDFPVTPGAFNTTYIEGDRAEDTGVSRWAGDAMQTFVAKLNRDGSSLVYATYLGGYQDAWGAMRGAGADYAASIDVDDAGNAYLTGTTYSSDYPTTPGVLIGTYTCCFSEAFVTKLNATGDGLLYSTFLGGRGYEFGWGIRADAAGNAYVTGETNSTIFPTTPGAFDRWFNSYYSSTLDYPDVFVSKLNPTGTNFVYSTYVGGGGWDWPYALAIDAAGAAYVTGETNSSNFPVTPGANDTAISPYYDAFVLKLAPNGRTLAYSTFLGGGRWDNAFGLAVDAAGNAYVTGQTNSTDFPTTPGALRDYLMGGSDAFVTKIDPTGATLLFSTYLGGSTFVDRGTSVAVNDLGEPFVTGVTYSVDFPLTPDAFDTRLNGREGFIAHMNATGSGLLYATYIGGSGDDERGSSIALDALGIAYITGWTNSSDFPTTPDAFDRTFAGQGDAFVVKLLPATARDPADLALAPADLAFSMQPARLGLPVTITATVHNLGGANATDVRVRFHDGPPSGSNQIGGDQVLPFVERFFGSAIASVVWTAGPIGTRDIWVVVDPLDAISEKREDNNAANAPLEVRPLEPDLVVTASDLSLSPPPPYVVGASVQVTATVRNVGDAPSGATIARFTEEAVPPATPFGGDQSLPSIPAGGQALASVTWTASASWTWTLCAIADPGGLVAEMDEGNNAACVEAKVLLRPDLRPMAVAVSPAPPLPYGTAALAYVTVRNWGEQAAGPFDVLLFDDGNGNRAPDGGEALGRESLAGLAGWDQTTVAVAWTAALAGVRSVCAYADPPPSAVVETNEANNVLCTAVEVWEPPPTLADYAPVLPQPTGTVRVGMGAPVTFSVQVRNGGNATGEAATTVAFHNATTPTAPFATFVLPPLAPGEDSARFVATWVSPAAPGTYAIVASVDPGHVIAEWDEANNTHTWTVEVLGGPMTSLLVGTPNATVAGTRYATSATPLSLDARDQSGTGIRRTAYRVDNTTWTDYAGPFTLPGEGDRYVEWYSEDNANNTEGVSWRVLRVDDTPPATTLTVGDPKHVAAETFVTSATPLALAAVDGGATPVGLGGIEYHVDAGGWTPYAGPFSLSGEGRHTVEYRSADLLGNAEAPAPIALVVDDSPPTMQITLGTPRHEGAATYVTSETPITIAATDGGAVPVGLAIVEHRVGGSWTPYLNPFTLTGPDGARTAEARAADLLGHAALIAISAVIDDTPPTTTASRGDGTYPVGTEFELAAADTGSGVAATLFSVDGGTWETYARPFALPEGAHAVRYYSTDRLNNTEVARELAVTIEGAPSSPKDTNWKPLMAAIFAAVLAMVGVGSVRRAPSRVGSRPRIRAFVFTALPFVALEAGTGVASLLTGLLAIPPLLGLGTAVDVAILLAGLAISVRRARRRHSVGRADGGAY